MAPTNVKKEAARLAEAKQAIKKMKERRQSRKRGDVHLVNPTVKEALASASSTNSNGFPQHDSFVSLRRKAKPTVGLSEKRQLVSNITVERKSPSGMNGSQHGLVPNGQRPARKSKKSSVSPKNQKEASVFDSPIFSANSPVDISGMSMSNEDVHYSPYIRPSGVAKVYVNRKKLSSVSSSLADPDPIIFRDEGQLPIPVKTEKDMKKSSIKDGAVPQGTRKKSKESSTKNLKLPQDLVIPQAKMKTGLKKKKTLKVSRQSINIKKPAAPMSIKKTCGRVKVPAFFVSADDSSGRSDMKTTQFYKNTRNTTVKSGFSVTTVSEKKLPVLDESSDDDESHVDELLSDEFEDIVEDIEDTVEEIEDVAEQVPSKPLYNSSAEFHFIDGQVILHLKHPSIFTFCGQVQVKVLKGTVEVLGYLLTPSSGYHTVFSPRGNGLLTLQTIPSNEVQTENKCDHDFIYTVDTLLKEGKPDDAFLLMEKSESVLPFFVSELVDFDLFPSMEAIECEENLFSKASQKLQCLCDPPVGSNIVQKGALWDEISEDIIQNPGCTVLCGGKDVGKSTFLRFLVNRLLINGNDQVLVIDFDPGQAELTVPGCVSLAVVKNPLLGPNFTHLENPLKCIYIGEVNVTKAVSRYMDACLTIISYWQSDEELRKMPCIVNTMGFTKGIGVTIMVQLLSALQPSRVIQITSNHPEFNYPEAMSVEYVKKSCSSSPFTINLDSTMHSQRHSLFTRGALKFKTHTISSVTSQGAKNIRGFDPRRRREAVVLSYLSQMVSAPKFSILDVVPYCCPLDTLYLNICHEAVPPAVTLSAFNANLVALCCVNPAEQDVVHLPGSGFPSIITKHFIADCLGFGIVRGIDMETRLLYLLTPVPTNVLASVNCLVLGAINLPSSIYFSPPREPGAVPYVIQGAKEQPSTGYSKCMSFN